MVTTNFVVSQLDSGWLKYLMLSILVNLLLLFMVNIKKQPMILQEIPLLKVNLMTLAASSVSEPVKPQLAQSPASAIPKKVVLERQAKRQVVAEKEINPSPFIATQAVITQQKMLEEKKRPSQKPVIVKPVVSTPIPNERPQVSTVIHKANYRKQTPPVYPRRAFELGQEGTVMLHVKITPTGLPRELKIAKSSGHRLLDIAASTAVKTWEFEPTRMGERSIASWVRVPVRFVIQ